MTEEQLHADVVAELFWGPGGRQRGRLPHPRFASSPASAAVHALAGAHASTAGAQSSEVGKGTLSC